VVAAPSIDGGPEASSFTKEEVGAILVGFAAESLAAVH